MRSLIAASLLATALASPAPPSAPSGAGRLLITPLDHAAAIGALATSDCATYHGIVGTAERSVLFYAPAGCEAEGARSVVLEWGQGELVWAGQTEVDEGVAELVERKKQLVGAFKEAWLVGESAGVVGGSQLRFGASQGPRLVAEIDHTQQLWQFPDDVAFEAWTSSPATSLHELLAISPSPLPVPPSFTQAHRATSSSDVRITDNVPVPPEHIARIQSHLDHLKFSPEISRLLSKVPIADIEQDVLYLSGERQLGATAETSWVSRHSMGEGSFKASKWLFSRFEEYGLACNQHRYRYGFAPMVACSLVGTEKPDEIVVIGAHFDSRGSFGYPGAPGADDDASGTSMLLALAREIHRHQLTFKRTLVLAAFSGEEQGLLGSKWYSQMLKDAGADVYLMIQQDMLAYRKPGEPLQLGLPATIGLDEVKYLVGNISTLYAPELVVGETAACCSDHQYFHQLGFAATQVFERNGPIADPMYHNSGDLVRREGYSIEQIHAAHSVVYATVLEVAGFNPVK